MIHAEPIINAKIDGCDCTGNLITDIQSLFTRRISNKKVNEACFQSCIDRNKLPSNTEDCENKCLHLSVSIDKVLDTDQNYEKIKSHYQNVYNIAPQKIGSSKEFIVFKFLKQAGKIKHTPSSGSPYHFSFYKQIHFKISDIVQITRIKFRDV